MNENEKKQSSSKTLSLRGGGGSPVRMNLSHGRSKSVLIETKRKKIILTNKNSPSLKERNTFKLEDSNKTNEKVFTEEEIDRRKKAIEAAREREILIKEEQEKLKNEKVFENEISPMMSNPIGLQNAFLVQFRLISKKYKLKILLQHPDLAANLQAGKTLTKDSKREQKSAGLNNLTPSEIKLFNDLNENYTRKFKHPFIKAVSGADKFQILTEFKRRIENSLEDEFTQSCEEVEKIASIRINQIFNQ